ncbi:hypothetical protein TorRG33x02_249870 [Trema orientale]|uniref:Uncharacterized protein n=1 Tax=Trema orientale TaxID=63057 RepID=A0A2P5DIY2_TREOI|nr:hypothetical protein TorRG33x02_249870 [Trema orientale]
MKHLNNMPSRINKTLPGTGMMQEPHLNFLFESFTAQDFSPMFLSVLTNMGSLGLRHKNQD